MRTTVFSILLVLVLATGADAGWQEDLDQVLSASPGEERDQLIGKVLAEAPGWKEIATRIRSRARQEASTGAILQQRTMTDGVERPWVLVVPEGYDPSKPTPLLVGLHGLVSRTDLVSDPGPYAEQTIYTELARARGWLTVIPFAQQGATWFDEVGMENLEAILRQVKRERNVDDDRVYIMGFSDGGSAGFSQAMVAPTDYAAFLALNGHLGVGSLFAKLETFAVNLRNAPVYAMTSDQDALYPTAAMRPALEMAIAAGGRIFFRSFLGTHSYDHVRPELGHLGDWLERHPREPFPPQVVWETADPARFGHCRWLTIDEITGGPRADWHRDHNAVLTDNRITIGFNHQEHEGEGVLVGNVVDDSFAAKVGLATGDLIVRINGVTVKAIADVGAAKGEIVPGGLVEIAVLREDRKMELSGVFPDTPKYWVFNHRQRSGRADATLAANRIDIRTSRVGALRIQVHPEMVNLSEPLTIQVNGEELFADFVEPDPEFLIRNYLTHRDRKLLYVAEVKVAVPLR